MPSTLAGCYTTSTPSSIRQRQAPTFCPHGFAFCSGQRARELRGQGIGAAVVGMLLSPAHATGVDLIEINVNEADVDAHRFYVRHGFSSTEPGSDQRAFYFFRELTV